MKEHIEKENYQSEDLKKLSIGIIERMFKLRMDLEIELAAAKAELASLKKDEP